MCECVCVCACAIEHSLKHPSKVAVAEFGEMLTHGQSLNVSESGSTLVAAPEVFESDWNAGLVASKHNLIACIYVASHSPFSGTNNFKQSRFKEGN